MTNNKTTTNILLLFSIILLVLLVLSVNCIATDRPKSVPKIEKGYIDLTHWDFSQHGSISLSGEWKFYWQKHILPGEDALSESGFIKAPKSWNNFKENGRKISGKGFATYRATVLLGEKRGCLALKLLDMATAYRLYINGKLIASSGHPGQTAETTQPFYSPMVASYNTDSDRMDIIIHVSNFNHWQGGMWEPIILGNNQELRDKRERNLIIDFFLFGSILMMGLYHLSLYWFRKTKIHYLYFGFLCLLVSIRILTQGERYIISLIPNISYEILLKLTYISFYLCVPLFGMYLISFFPKEVSKKALWTVQIVGSAFSIWVLFTPAKIYTYGMLVFEIFTIILIVYYLWTIIIANIRNRDGALVFLIGCLILFVTVTNDILYTRQWIITGYFAPVGLFIFIFSQIFLLSQQFSRTYLLVEKQSHDLKKEIADRIKIETELKKSELRYRQYFEEIQSGAFISTPDGQLLECNQEFVSIFGFSSMKESLETPLSSLYQDPDRKIEFIRELKKNKGVKHFETNMLKKDGSVIKILKNAVGVFNKRGDMIRIRGYVLDITELKALEDQLNQAKK
ncbi:MAG: PAS domain S-box protein, partial [Desulfobacteraceae bacterium]|nr:PAS domain S-box protein [Desulfobacteraceae bacterium]